MTLSANLPASAPSLCPLSPPLESGNLSLTAPHSAPTLTRKHNGQCNNCREVDKNIKPTTEMFTLHSLCLSPALLLDRVQLLPLKWKNNHLDYKPSTYTQTFLDLEIINGPGKQDGFVHKPLVLMRPVSQCPQAKHVKFSTNTQLQIRP